MRGKTIGIMYLANLGQGTKRKPQCLSCPVLQYADDTLLIIKVDAAQLSLLKNILDQLSSFTGLHINYDKSTFVPSRLDPAISCDLAHIFGFSLLQKLTNNNIFKQL